MNRANRKRPLPVPGGRRFLPPVLFVLLILFATSAWGETVRKIRVEGSSRIAAASVVKTLGIEQGDILSVDAIAEGIKNLYGTRQFDRIDVEKEIVPGTGEIDLVVIIVERALLGTYEILGNDKIKDDDIFEETLLKKGLVLSRRTLFRESRRIHALYKEKGYRNASISWEPADDDSVGRANVRFRVEEGKKVKVKRVVVLGAGQIDEGRVRKEMKTKPDSWIRSGDFKEETFEEDKEKIEAFYKKRGFLDARIESTSVTADENGKDLTVTIWVKEGQKYYAGSFSFDGNEEFNDEVLQSAIRLKDGDVFNQQKYEESVGNLYSIYSERGFIFSNIVPERRVVDNRINIAFHINEGNPARINRVQVAGNTRTKERTIRRELVIAPGDLFKRSRIIRSQRELLQLGFFQDIRFDYSPVQGTDKIDITFDVIERQTGEASAGAGFSSINGATGFVRLGQSNLFGGGERLNLTWEFGDFQQIELSYTEPWLFDTPTTAGFDIAKIRRNWDSFFEKRLGGGVRLGRRLPWLDYSRADFAYRLEEREIEPRSNASQAVIDAAGKSTLSSTRLTFTRNSTDRLFHPTSGSVAILVGEWAGGPIGGTTEYQQYEVENRWYYPSFWKFFLGLRARMGVVDGLENASTVPLYKRYRLGGTGIWGLRGYDDRSIVPEGNSFDFGGRTMLVLSAEYKFPIAENQIWGLFFFDAGNTWNSFRDVRPNDLNRGAGLGIRFQIPMLGQLGFDFAYGLDREEGAGWQPHFQLGSLF